MSKKMVTVSLFIFFAVVVAVLVAGLVFNDRRQNSAATQTTGNTNTASGPVTLSLAELAKHNSASDCWLLINGKVYDVTAAIAKHPGGAGTIIPTCGREATSDFDTKGGEGQPHSTRANSMLQDYYLGQLNATISVPVK